MIDETHGKMIEEFQCPGCVCGHNIECERFLLQETNGYFWCDGHVPGTRLLGSRSPRMCIGLPRGFCRFSEKDPREQIMRLWVNGSNPKWDNLNIAVWAMEWNGYLFVRTYMPRVDISVVDVVKNGTLEMIPNAIDVSEFWDSIE